MSADTPLLAYCPLSPARIHPPVPCHRSSTRSDRHGCAGESARRGCQTAPPSPRRPTPPPPGERHPDRTAHRTGRRSAGVEAPRVPQEGSVRRHSPPCLLPTLSGTHPPTGSPPPFLNPRRPTRLSRRIHTARLPNGAAVTAVGGATAARRTAPRPNSAPNRPPLRHPAPTVATVFGNRLRPSHHAGKA